MSNEKHIQVKAFSKCGDKTGYDFESFILRQPIKLLTGRWRNRGEEKESEKMICSEFTGWVYGMHNWFKMTPDDQYEYLTKSSDWVEVKQ